ncbi:MAG: ribonuclease HII [Flammeovirgaceae bacterium]|jgi:ribonuclease HII
MLPFFHKKIIEAGLDEVGRGCLAGPVVAAAVILPKDYKNPILNDSKKMSEKNRVLLDKDIRENAISFAVSEVSHLEIDEINILNASFLAMHQALDLLETVPEFLLVDGNRFHPYKEIPFECVIKGDGKYMPIAAASVLAKVYRDNLMREWAEKHPEYGWETNVGYPTKKHRSAIAEFGTTSIHRKSFQLLPKEVEVGKDK